MSCPPSRCEAANCKEQIERGSWICLRHWMAALPEFQSDLKSVDCHRTDVNFAFLKACLAAKYARLGPGCVLDVLGSRKSSALQEIEQVLKQLLGRERVPAPVSDSA